MVRIKLVCRLGLPLIVLHGLTACSWLDKTFPDKAQDYKRAEPTESLEVPPDLTTTPTTDVLVVPSGPATLSGYTTARESLHKPGGGDAVLPQQGGATFEREQDRAWLVIPGEPQAVWPVAREFWIQNGFFIMREDPALGTLETDWAENRALIPKGPVRRLISRVYENAYSSAYRDRFRMRLERGEKPGTTELFVTHQGVEEILQTSGDEIGTTKWGPRPPDPGMESEMLKRMMVYLGVQPAQVEQKFAEAAPKRSRAELVQQGSGQATLVMHDAFDKAWRNVGIVLDRVGFAVEDRDRLQGLYYVRYNDPLKDQEDSGLLSKLAFWSSDEEKVDHFQIKLSDDGADTRVVVLDEKGNPETSITAVRILNLLYDELK
jgi:outer membrane protein assembly factor BamC